MKKALGVFLGLIGVLIVCCLGIIFIPNGLNIPNPFEAISNHAQSAAENVVESAKNAATNAVIDASGIKGRINDTIDEYKTDIINATGISEDVADSIIEDIAVDDWQAATLPDEAIETGTIDGSVYGVDGTVTTYDDPGYITVEAYGQTVTLAIPESAQEYLPLLSMLG